MPWNRISGGSVLEGGEEMEWEKYQAVIRRPKLIEEYKRVRQERRKFFEEGCREHKMHTPEWGDQIAMYDGELMGLRKMLSESIPVGSIWIDSARKATPAEMKNAPRSGNSGGANNNKYSASIHPERKEKQDDLFKTRKDRI